ncbi:hypothetical protein [Candidatus Symbiobacter mobilis]|uniref:Uncharacterized protein n=1 Tax=Candidatus Symbiobacter mobilis CR TaxID=946483 RepID=U5N6D7_9BURK|nr:hypothetical protein [Candidatus Symbiobacter mobilis]AGX87096.1 hypothetical protein Cenrod_0997 [Candidatus Symbiobacter mobilis CR]
MRFAFGFFRFLGRGILGLGLFMLLSVLWTMVMFAFNPWLDAKAGQWRKMQPIIVGDAEAGTTRVVLYGTWIEERSSKPHLVPLPLDAEGTQRAAHVFTAWRKVADQPWQYEATWDDGDYLLQSRYRVDARGIPVLIQARGRDPSLAFLGMILAVVTLVIWKGYARWRTHRVFADSLRDAIKG